MRLPARTFLTWTFPTWTRGLSLSVGLVALCSIASGYYNFIYFASRNGPFTNPLQVRFDSNALGNTVSYLISDQPPSKMMPNDSYTAIVSQIRSAASVWSGVSTSALRLSYGGVALTGTGTTPGIDVVFDDNMPPGLLAQTRVTTPSDPSPYVSLGFIPLQRSKVQLRSDLTVTIGSVQGMASYSDVFYTTLVHEFGHALGLQHSLVSGTMATYVTRATTKGHPLTADDVAAVSMLYPAPGYAGSTGSITGTVTLNGNGVNLASVVALSTDGTVISALTNPDGSYTIYGLPAGPGRQYYVYAHPLPPAQQGEAYPNNVVPPQDLQGTPFPAVTGFVTQFYTGNGSPGGTRDWTKAAQVSVNAGAISQGVNFAVQASPGPAIYNLQTYAYQGPGAQIPVPSPYLTPGSRQYLVFTANGIVVNGTQLAPGLNVSVIGNAASLEPNTLAYYQQGFAYEVIDGPPVSNVTPVAVTPVALALTTNTDLYVLPAAVTVTPNAPPSISSVNSSTDGQGNTTVTITGTHLLTASRVLFDGAASGTPQPNSDGTSLTVSAPSAQGGYSAFVEVVSGDGQSTAQTLGTAQPLTLTYQGSNNAPQFTLGTGVLTAGTDTAIDIKGVNTQFTGGPLDVGFGTSDILVRNVFVAGPNELLVNVTVMPGAGAGPFPVSVASGLQLVTLPGILQTQLGGPQQVSLRSSVQSQPYGGSYNALIPVTGLPASAITPQNTLASGWALSIGGLPAPPTSVTSNQITAPVNSSLRGPQLIQLVAPTGPSIPPIAIQALAAPPNILTYPTAPVGLGDAVTILVSNLTAADSTALSNVVVQVNGITQTVTGVIPQGSNDIYSVQFKLTGNIPAGLNNSLTVAVGARISVPANLAVHN